MVRFGGVKATIFKVRGLTRPEAIRLWQLYLTIFLLLEENRHTFKDAVECNSPAKEVDIWRYTSSLSPLPQSHIFYCSVPLLFSVLVAGGGSKGGTSKGVGLGLGIVLEQ